MRTPSPDGGAMPPPSSSLNQRTASCPARQPPFSGGARLTRQIEFRRMQLAELEAEMVTACEAAALGGRPRREAESDREHWDRTTWQRYLAAAMRLEATYGPRMRRLHQEIGQLERLMTVLIAA